MPYNCIFFVAVIIRTMLRTLSNIYNGTCTAQKKWSFLSGISSVNVVIFTGEILNGKLHFLCGVEIKNANENRSR